MKAFNIILFMAALTLGATHLTAAQDWPKLEFYKAENDALDVPGPDENRIVFMGDSIFEYWKKLVPEYFEENPYLDRGISGQTTPQMLIRFRQDVIALQPQVVVILAGTNDIAGNTGPSTPEMVLDNIQSMIELAQVNEIEVVLCSILPAFAYPWKPGVEPAEIIVDLNHRLKELAEKTDAVYCDFFPEMSDARNGLLKELSEDGVHPNRKGYEVMAPIVDRAIVKAIKKRGD